MNKACPAVFVLHANGFDHDLHQIAARLHANNVQDTTFRLHEEGFDFSVGIYGQVSRMRIDHWPSESYLRPHAAWD